jgi:hypothetical protein
LELSRRPALRRDFTSQEMRYSRNWARETTGFPWGKRYLPLADSVAKVPKRLAPDFPLSEVPSDNRSFRPEAALAFKADPSGLTNQDAHAARSPRSKAKRSIIEVVVFDPWCPGERALPELRRDDAARGILLLGYWAGIASVRAPRVPQQHRRAGRHTQNIGGKARKGADEQIMDCPERRCGQQ